MKTIKTNSCILNKYLPQSFTSGLKFAEHVENVGARVYFRVLL